MPVRSHRRRIGKRGDEPGPAPEHRPATYPADGDVGVGVGVDVVDVAIPIVVDIDAIDEEGGGGEGPVREQPGEGEKESEAVFSVAAESHPHQHQIISYQLDDGTSCIYDIYIPDTSSILSINNQLIHIDHH